MRAESHRRVNSAGTFPGGERFELIEALVDRGATYTWIPRDVLEGLGVVPDEAWPLERLSQDFVGCGCHGGEVQGA